MKKNKTFSRETIPILKGQRHTLDTKSQSARHPTKTHIKTRNNEVTMSGEHENSRKCRLTLCECAMSKALEMWNPVETNEEH